MKAPIDLVYAYASGHSTFREREMLYSLRSVLKFMKNFRNIYIIGDLPVYLEASGKLIHIQFDDNEYQCKEQKIMEKFLFACGIPEISQKFLMMNDDYFLTKPIDAQNVPYFYQTTLVNKILHRNREDVYYRSMNNTLKALQDAGIKFPKYFDIHYPMYYDKDKFPKVMLKYDWRIRAGYIVKSLYANTLKIAGKKRKDYKIIKDHSVEYLRNVSNSADLISTDQITRNMITLLNEMYPKPTKFEKKI